MADLEGHAGLGREAHLYFGRGGSVESFPLPDGLRRWIVQEVENSLATGAALLGACVILLALLLRRPQPRSSGSVITQSMDRR